MTKVCRFALMALYALALPAFGADECAVSDFEVRLTRVKWVDKCRAESCPQLTGTGVLTNKCQAASGAQVRINGLDARGTPIATSERWPFSTRNVPPGVHSFSIDQWLEADSDIKQLTIEVVEVKRW